MKKTFVWPFAAGIAATLLLELAILACYPLPSEHREH